MLYIRLLWFSEGTYSVPLSYYALVSMISRLKLLYRLMQAGAFGRKAY